MMEIDHHVFPISNGDFPILGGCFSHLQTTPVKLLYVVWQHFVTLIDYVPILKKNLSCLFIQHFGNVYFQTVVGIPLKK